MANKETYAARIGSPFGDLCAIAKDGVVHSIHLPPVDPADLPPGARWVEPEQVACLREASEFLTAYFSGDRGTWRAELLNAGEGFKQKVWRAVARIPFGTVLTYGQVAEAIGHPGAARAVGNAMATNPLPIIVPCHRVIAAGGKLGGYGGGEDMKRKLLQFEGVELL